MGLTFSVAFGLGYETELNSVNKNRTPQPIEIPLVMSFGTKPNSGVLVLYVV